MAVKISIPTPLRGYAGGQSEVEVDATTAGEALSALVMKHPQLEKHLYKDGKLRSFVNVFVNDSSIRDLEGEATPVSSSDEVLIVPSIAGGVEMELSNEEVARYSRHLILPEVALEGQKKLKRGSVLLVGAGGLGSPLALYLAAAGVGRIGIVDFDVVDASNLQRQVLHGTSTVGRPKLESAKARLHDLNPNVQVDTYEEHLSSENALKLIGEYDVVADGTDNFPTRYLVNDACVLTGTPNAYGSIFRFEGQASVFGYKGGPCYRCLYPEPPPPGLVPSCAEGGVLGILPGLIGVVQATEVVKILLEQGETLSGRLLLYDALRMKFRELKVKRAADCPVCGQNPSVTELIDYEEFCGFTPADAEQDSGVPDISVAELQAMLANGNRDFVLLDVREPHEAEICRLPDSVLIPKGQVPDRLGEIPKDQKIVCYCKAGGRSRAVSELLAENGYDNVINVAGGITAWAKEIDTSMPTY